MTKTTETKTAPAATPETTPAPAPSWADAMRQSSTPAPETTPAPVNAAPSDRAAMLQRRATAAAQFGGNGRGGVINPEYGSLRIKLLTPAGVNVKSRLSALRFALYRNGMTVAEYAAAVVAQGHYPASKALADIANDTKCSALNGGKPLIELYR